MVIIDNDRITIVVQEIMPAEVWHDMVNDLLDLLYCESDDFSLKHRATINLLQNMMPTIEQAKAMCGVEPNREKYF